MRFYGDIVAVPPPRNGGTPPPTFLRLLQLAHCLSSIVVINSLTDTPTYPPRHSKGPFSTDTNTHYCSDNCCSVSYCSSGSILLNLYTVYWGLQQGNPD